VDVSPIAYEQGRIPDALLWNAYADLRDNDHRPVSRAQLEDLLSRSGIAPDTTVVVYGYSAPLGFWLLKANSHRGVRMLAGRRERWAQAGYAWSTELPRAAASNYRGLVESPDLVANQEQVQAAITDPAQLLLDVRAEAEYRGECFWPSGASEDKGRAGHVPGAINVPIYSLRTEDETLKSLDELRGIFEPAGVTQDKTVITYCTIANRASQAWFGLKYLLDYPDVRVYYGSWVEWGKAAGTPVET
jgi:thiosulfate/3-mercaptopyruvate sulfurtransferase